MAFNAPAGHLTLIDVARSDNEAAGELLVEAATAAPEIGVFGADPIPGTKYSANVVVELPGAGIRNVNEGRELTKGKTVRRDHTTQVVNPEWAVEQSVGREHAGGIADLMDREAGLHTMGAMIDLGQRCFYDAPKGTDAKITGLIHQMSPQLVVDAGGPKGEALTSIFFCKVGRYGARFVVGFNGEWSISEQRTQVEIDHNDGSRKTVVSQEMMARVGFVLESQKSVCRIANINLNADPGQPGHLTDALIRKAIGMMPQMFKPDVAFLRDEAGGQIATHREGRSTSVGYASNPEDLGVAAAIYTESLKVNEAHVAVAA